METCYFQVACGATTTMALACRFDPIAVCNTGAGQSRNCRSSWQRQTVARASNAEYFVAGSRLNTWVNCCSNCGQRQEIRVSFQVIHGSGCCKWNGGARPIARGFDSSGEAPRCRQQRAHATLLAWRLDREFRPPSGRSRDLEPRFCRLRALPVETDSLAPFSVISFACLLASKAICFRIMPLTESRRAAWISTWSGHNDPPIAPHHTVRASQPLKAHRGVGCKRCPRSPPSLDFSGSAGLSW
jgi:hypothetical protein